jgi:hypothetical protein
MASAPSSPLVASGRWSRIAPLCGLLFVLFVVGSVFVATEPSTNASTASILHYYRTHKSQVTISGLLIPPAVVFGLIWFSYLRTWLQRRDVDPRWGTVTFAGGILFAVTGGVVAGVLIALSDSPHHLGASSAQTLNFLQSDLPSMLASMAMGVMGIAAGIAMLKSSLLPTWLGWVSVVVGILSVVPFGDFIALPGIGIWTLIILGVIWFRTDPDDGGSQARAVSN